VQIGGGAIIDDGVVLGHQDGGKLVIGPGARIRSGTIIYSGVTIGDNFKTGHHALIREDTVIGDDVLAGTGVVIDGHCRIGNNVSMQTNAYVTANTVLEDDVFMGPCSVTTNDKYMVQGAELTGATIKKGARIGANATVLPGIIVGECAVVGAGAVVTKNVGAGETVVGTPATALHKEI